MSKSQDGQVNSGKKVNMAAWRRLPAHNEDFTEPRDINRRDVLKLMGASAGLAVGIPGCKRKPERKIISRVSGPEYQKPGEALYYSSTWTEGNFPYGMIVKTVDGRPIKIEGNPDHPINGGSTSAAMQCNVQSLYDPDRFKGPRRKGRKEFTWDEADHEIAAALGSAKSAVLLTRSTLGPSERALVSEFLSVCPAGRHFVYETVHDGLRRSAWRKIYGRDGELLPDFSKAKVILSVGCDFLGSEALALEAIGQFAQTRAATAKSLNLSRLWVAEAAMTVTGSNADHRLRIRPSQALAFVQALRAGLKGEQEEVKAFAAQAHLVEGELSDLVEDLRNHRNESVVVAGGHLPEPVHAAVCLLNEEIGAWGRTLSWNSAPSSLAVDGPGEIESALAEGVDVLICLGVNPMYDWPGGGFEKLLTKAKLSVGHGLFENETLSQCTIALASSHNLESWNDAVGRFGIESLCQPVIGPLYDSRQEAESLLKWTQLLAKQKGGDQKIGEIEDWHNYVQSQWQRRHFPKAKDGQTLWEEALRTGVSVTVIDTKSPRMRSSEAEQLAASGVRASGSEQAGGYELLILPDYGVYDGRFANSSWLQELPDPVTRLVWDNAAMVSPATAEKLGVREGDLDHGNVVGDMLEITAAGKTIELGVLIVPGIADDVIVTTLGYGRTKGGPFDQAQNGEIGTGGGMNVAGWIGRGSQNESPWCRVGAMAKKSSRRYAMVRTQKTFDMGGRAIVLDGTVEEYEHDRKNFIKHKKHMPAPADLYGDHDYSSGYQWAMSIDMNKCVGCNACVSACQAENNVAVVGKEECGKGREMHWLRIDRYHEGDPSNPKVHQQLMLCQHCENAPCETVCPVNATAHSPEGLNEMIYNRCVGTRYCANNCPYKVRRFNFFDYTQRTQRAAEQELLFNPQVTVRSRGVMEKCTFCVQRINAAKYAARNSGDESAIEELQTACQQVCPAGAIVFGDKNNPASETAKLLKADLNYYVLEELNVKPRVGYLARIRNPVGG